MSRLCEGMRQIKKCLEAKRLGDSSLASNDVPKKKGLDAL
jgi:hypothetical protein